MEPRGPKLGWWLGGAGSLLWLPIMSAVWLVQGNTTGAMLGVLAGLLPCKRGVQLVAHPAWELHELGDTQILVAGAAEALNYFV